MNNKLLLVGILVLVLVSVVGYLYTTGYFGFLGGRSLTGGRSAPISGQDSSRSTSSGLGQQVETVEIKEVLVSGNEYSFTPASITLSKGQRTKIVFKNIGNTSHDFVVDELGVKTAVISGGQEIALEVVPEKTATYSFYCSVGNHRNLGMEGKLTVN